MALCTVTYFYVAFFYNEWFYFLWLSIFPSIPQRSAGSTSVQFFDAMIRMRETVANNWKEMRRMFRQVDTAGSGLVEAPEFRYVLRQYNVNLDEDEFYHLMSYYDKNMDGKISYNDFIKAYLQNS